MIYSSVSLKDVLLDFNTTYEFGCLKLLINGEVVWDDDVSINEYVEYGDACRKYLSEHPDLVVINLNIQIADFHHSIISITCMKR